MALIDALLPEFDREMGVTRKLLERVPDGQFAWRPHEKSMTLGRLAEHLAELPMWLSMTLTTGGLEMTVGRPEGYRSPATREAVLAMFDANVKAARAQLTGKTDAELLAPWTLTQGGKEVFTMPKASVIRGFVLNHLIHHRGQLSVYLRMQGAVLPSIYGPSGDEAM
ncbi:MAG: DinB family protein [Acidobacteriota bacterium]